MMERKKIKGLFFVSALCVFILTYAAYAIPNPSAVYCKSMDYEYVIEETDEGQVGKCRMPDGSLISGWAFLQGQEGQEYNYCNRNGYEYYVAEDDRCPGMYFGGCVICVLPDGTEIEETELMKERGEFPDLSNYGLDPPDPASTTSEPSTTTTLLNEGPAEALEVEDDNNSLLFGVALVILIIISVLYLKIKRK